MSDSSGFHNLFRSLVVLFLFGAVLGTFGDYSHVLSGTLSYPYSYARIPWTDLPWWDPLLMGTATLLLGLPDLTGSLSRGKMRMQSFSFRSVAWMTAAFVGLYWISGFLPLQTGGLRDAVLGSLALGIWWTFDRSPESFGLGLVAAASGSAVEIFLVSRSVFHYESPNFFGIASWIPWLYFAAVVPVRALVAVLCSAPITTGLQT
jgi:hypothetical protein